MEMSEENIVVLAIYSRNEFSFLRFLTSSFLFLQPIKVGYFTYPQGDNVHKVFETLGPIAIYSVVCDCVIDLLAV